MMKRLVDLYRESHLGNRLPAYDGRKSLYTAGPLPFSSKEFKIALMDDDDGSGGQRWDTQCSLISLYLYMGFVYSLLTHLLDAGGRENLKW